MSIMAELIVAHSDAEFSDACQPESKEASSSYSVSTTDEGKEDGRKSSSESANTQPSVSLLSCLRSPPSELARIRKVRQNPPKRIKRRKGSVAADPKVDWVVFT